MTAQDRPHEKPIDSTMWKRSIKLLKQKLFSIYACFNFIMSLHLSLIL